MPLPLFLGLDLGSTNAKAALYDSQGTLVGEQAVAYPTDYSQPGGAEQRLTDWTDALTQACRGLMAKIGDRSRDLAAIGLAAHGPGVILLDGAGAPLLPTSPTWQDTRCTAHGETLLKTVGTAWTGLHIARNSFPAQLKWIAERDPAQAAQAHYAVGIKDYLIYWLTGALLTEPTQVAGGHEWAPALIAASGWTVTQLPRVAPATQIAGLVRPALVRALGLSSALPVVSGLADGAAATLSMGAIHPSQAVLTLATSGVIRVVMPAAVAPTVQLTHNLFCWPYVEGRWIAGGHIKAAAGALHWLHGVLAPTALAPTLTDLLANAAESPVGSRGVIFLPYLLGRGSPCADEMARGAFLGLSPAHDRSDMTRAVLEGVAFAYRDVLDDFVAMGHAISKLHVSGGGAANPLWRQILADVLQRPLIYYSADSTLGAAMVAAIGTGHCANVQAAVTAMVQPGERTEPAAAQSERYEAVLQTYRAWRDRLYDVRRFVP
jgi:sugar (pentulose or hexulose) kinase